MAADRTESIGDGQILDFLILFDYFQFGIFGVLDDYFLLTGQGVVVPAKFADESMSVVGVFNEEQFEAEGTKLHYYWLIYKRKFIISINHLSP